MTLRSGHMKDSRLFATYLDKRSGEPLDPRVVDHLATCDDCADRFEEMASLMNELRDAADVATDDAFSAERLDTQRRQILQRLEHVHRPARVISFPRRDVAADGRAAGRTTPRWIAGAAAAGLFIGFAAGGYLGPERLHRATTHMASTKVSPAMSVQRSATTPPAVRIGTTQPEPDDDAFMMDLEVALTRPHNRELQPFDAMTPHVRDLGR